MEAMKGIWTHADLIDLEFFLGLDQAVDHKELHERDRQIYLGFTDSVQEEERDGLLHGWIERRRSQLYPSGTSPGRQVVESFRTTCLIFIVCAAIVGGSAGLTFFSYTGTTPVNVLHFLFIFVFSQLLMLALLLCATSLRLVRFRLVPTPIAGLYGAVTAWVLRHSKKLGESMPGERLTDITQIESLLKKQKTTYGPVFYWPFFRLSQQVMVSFNLGLLATTSFRILTRDIAFGWQSTIQFSTEFIGTATRVLALPWSWFVADRYAYPTLAQIEGSRIILKDGIYHLQTQDLVSWWPFLVLCILFYGVFVRLLLLLVSKGDQWLAMKRLKTDRPILLQLTRRMTTPLMSSQSPEPDSITDRQAIEHEALQPDPAGRSIGTTSTGAHQLLMLLNQEVSEGYDTAVLARELEKHGFSACGYEVVPDRDLETHLQKLLQAEGTPAYNGLLLIMESWMPPIKETLDFVKKVRLAAGAQAAVFVGLAGPGSDRQAIHQPGPEDREIWQNRLDTLADPYLSIIDLGIQPDDDDT